jgi:hypothetical protein
MDQLVSAEAIFLTTWFYPHGWSLPLGVNLAPRGELVPQVWTLSPRRNGHPFVHPHVWTLSTV